MSEIKISKEVSKIKEEISQLNLGQISELIDGLKEEYNIQETAIVQSATATTENEKTDEKSNKVSVKLVEIKDMGLSSIKVYGLIKDAIGELKGEVINIIQAKKLTEKEDKIILEDIPRDKAEEFQKKIEKGAKVEIK